MREILLVTISALLGYIVVSAFSSTTTPQEAMRKIIEQPQTDMKLKQELAFVELEKTEETKRLALENQQKLEELRTYQDIAINSKENDTKVQIKEIDSKISSDLANLKYASQDNQKTRESNTLIVIAILIFILIFVYLRYQKNLVQAELEKDTEYKEMMAKKEYAEKILTLLTSGNLSIEMEKKLLNMLDELNNGSRQSKNDNFIYHPNPEIEQLPFQKK